MRSTIILLGIASGCALGQIVRVDKPIAEGQVIRVDEPPAETIDVDGSTDTVDVDGATVASGGVEVPEEDEITLPGTSTTAKPPSQPTAPAPAPPQPPQEEPEPVVAISAVLYSSSPGPKDCRGGAMMRVGLPKPGAQHATPACYNVRGVAQCAVFMANQDDGCQARIFAEPDCLTFMNLAVFTPERKPMGGAIRSIEITCGVVSEAPPPLNLPGMILPPGGAQQAFGK